MAGRRTGPTESIPPIRLPRLGPSGVVAPAPTPPSPTPTPAANDAAHADPAKLRQIKDILADSTTGAAAFKYLEDNRLTVEFRSGHGSGWNGSRITIDDDKALADAALSLVHEVRHARATNEHTSANITTDTREDYVRKMLDEEVSAKIEALRTSNELAAHGTTFTRTVPLATQYNNAYKAAADALKASTPSSTEADLAAAGEKAGQEAVAKGFREGAVVTSNTHERYPAYYERLWDERHPPTGRSTP